VENIFEELNAPGEWFADKEKGLLYYYPPKGVNLSQTNITVSHLKTVSK
jgi:hypothetical protein